MSRASAERLRQERETFDLAKAHARRWFGLRLLIGYVSIVLLPVVATVCTYVVVHPTLYSGQITVWATGALGADVIGIVWTVLKVVLNPVSMTKLTPVTPPSPSPRTRIKQARSTQRM